MSPAVLVRRSLAGARAVLVEERGASLPELLVGVIVSAIVMGAVGSIVFTSSDLHRRAADRSRIAAELAIVSLSIDRDGAMATATAPALAQTTATGCGTAIDLGFIEAGASVRYRTVAAAAPADGPLVLERVSGAGSRVLARNVTSCTWQSARDTGGRWSLRLDLALGGGSGEAATQTIRAAPRLW